jgi:hypothetical protein
MMGAHLSDWCLWYNRRDKLYCLKNKKRRNNNLDHDKNYYFETKRINKDYFHSILFIQRKKPVFSS